MDEIKNDGSENSNINVNSESKKEFKNNDEIENDLENISSEDLDSLFS